MQKLAAISLYMLAVFSWEHAAAGELLLRYPIVDPDGSLINSSMVVGVDHDPEDKGGIGYDCTNFDGLEDFPYCYDQHKGTDYILLGGFETMDSGSAVIVAGADGVVTDVDDSHYDRCHVDIANGTVTCDGNPIIGNGVTILHDGGYTTKYWHIMQDSALVAVGDPVLCGQPLALMGSSGMSTSPHLHFEIRGPEGDVVDPYAGIMSQPESFWVQQEGPLGVPGEHCAWELEEDMDGDGVVDFLDNCPETANADQSDGDGDGVGTACDDDEIDPGAEEALVELGAEPVEDRPEIICETGIGGQDISDEPSLEDVMVADVTVDTDTDTIPALLDGRDAMGCGAGGGSPSAFGLLLGLIAIVGLCRARGTRRACRCSSRSRPS